MNFVLNAFCCMRCLIFDKNAKSFRNAQIERTLESNCGNQRSHSFYTFRSEKNREMLKNWIPKNIWQKKEYFFRGWQLSHIEYIAILLDCLRVYLKNSLDCFTNKNCLNFFSNFSVENRSNQSF